MRAHNRVREACSTTGTGNFGCGGAASGGYKAFGDRYANGEEFEYTRAGTTQWEVGWGRYDSGANEIVRVEVYESSNGDALVNFTEAGFVWIDHPAEMDNSTGESLAIARGEFMP